MTTVTFTIEVDVDDEYLDEGDDPVDAAYDILYEAPAFDGLSDEIVSMLEVVDGPLGELSEYEIEELYTILLCAYEDEYERQQRDMMAGNFDLVVCEKILGIVDEHRTD